MSHLRILSEAKAQPDFNLERVIKQLKRMIYLFDSLYETP